LYDERLKQAERYRAGQLGTWPFCEGYIPSQALLSGLNIKELAAYGDISAYDSWPPYLEEQLPELKRKAFVHPVLDPEKYLPSLIKWNSSYLTLANPLSWVHRRLWRLGAAGYLRAITGSDFRKAFANARMRKRVIS
jgi:hypothetical protein